MSMIEILSELPKLKPNERNLLLEKLSDLEASPVAMSEENELSTEEIREHVRKWTLSE
jgi:hypothetical protein